MDRTAGSGASPAGTDGSLSRLLQTEALLAARLSAAEQEAVRIRAAARDAARADEAGVARETAAVHEALAREYAERRQLRLAQVEAEKARRVEALRALPDAEVCRLAGDLVDRLLQHAAGAAP